MQLLSFTLNQTTVTLFISTSVINNSIGFNSFSTLLLVLSQKLQNSITLLLISNHFTSWLKITQRIQYKILSLTYKSLQYNKPSSISDLLTIQPTRSTHPSAVVTLQRPSNPSRLKISDRSFYFQAPSTLACSTTPSSLSFSFFSISFSSLTIFFSIPQAAENSPFSSFLSSLAYLLSTGLTPKNFDMAFLSFIGIYHCI